MTVAALPSKVDYLENGLTTSFELKFRFLPGTITASRVLTDGTVVALAAGVDFSTSGGSTDAGGELALTGASVAGAKLRIRRQTPRVQGADYVDDDSFPAASHEAALDRSMLVDQEQDDRIADTANRALLVPDGESAPQLPTATDRANRFMAFDPAGNLVMSQGTGADIGLRQDLVGPGGGGRVGTASGETVQQAMDLNRRVLAGPSVGAINRKTIALQLPLFFPDYASLLSEAAAAYIYPSAFAIDEAADEIFITGGYDINVGHNLVWVFRWSTGAYISCFRVAFDGAAEGLEVLYDGATRYIYTAAGVNIARYDITTLPANKASPVATTFAVNLGTQFSHCNGKWYVEQNEAGATNSRTVFRIYDSDLTTPLGTKVFDVADTGFITTATSPYGLLIPKKQGIAFGLNVIISTHGGYIGDGDPVTGYGYQGTKVYDAKAQVLAEGLLHPQKMMDRLKNEGLTVSRIENEGVKIMPGGQVYSLYVHRGRLDTPSPTSDGLIVFEEFSLGRDAIDFSEDAEVYNAVALPQAIVRLGTIINGKLINPTTGQDFNTLDEVIGWMCDYRVRGVPVSFYTSGLTISDYAGAMPAGILVRITNVNDLTFMVEYIGENQSRSYAVVTAGGALGGARSARSPIAELITAVSIRLQSAMSDATAKLGRIFGAHYSNSEPDFLAIDVQGNSGSNNIFYGGGSGSYNSAMTHRFYTGETTTTRAGTLRLMIDQNGNFVAPALADRNYADDVAAAVGGVPVNGLYHNAGAVRIRRT